MSLIPFTKASHIGYETIIW